MVPWLEDVDVRLFHGDALDVLKTLPDASVHMCATSPPFYGLRDYGTGTWEGGDPDCDHAKPMTTMNAGFNERWGQGAGEKKQERKSEGQYAGTCEKCGATRVDRQIGLEDTPDEWVSRLVDVFREVRRVLRDDGTLWVEIGDSYLANQGGGFNSNAYRGEGHVNERRLGNETPMRHPTKPKDLLGQPWMLAFALRADGWVLRSEIIWARPNPMPESVTDRPTKSHSTVFLFAKARWSGPVEPWPMREQDKAWLAAIVDGEGSICFQESPRAEYAPHISPRLSIVNTNRDLLARVAEVTSISEGTTPSPRLRGDGSEGRPIFTWQVTNEKAARIIAAIEPHLIAKRRQAALAIYVQSLNQKHKGRGGHRTTDKDLAAKRRCSEACSSLNRTGEADLAWFKPVSAGRWVPNDYSYDADAIREAYKPDGRTVTTVQGGENSEQHRDGERWPNPAGANARSVWTLATEPTPFAHFATWPQKLVARMIRAGTSERGCCPECGAPWIRDTERSIENPGNRTNNGQIERTEKQRAFAARRETLVETLGWSPSCDHDLEPTPCTVLDPFAGSGTTCLVARNHGRHSIGIELNADYLKIAAVRLAQQSLLA